MLADEFAKKLLLTRYCQLVIIITLIPHWQSKCNCKFTKQTLTLKEYIINRIMDMLLTRFSATIFS